MFSRPGCRDDRSCYRRNAGSYRRFLRRLAGRIDHALYRYSRSCTEYAYGDRYCFRTWTEYLEFDAAVGITSVPQFVRITRAAVLTVRNQEYVEASKAIGLNNRKIIFKHILPNCLSPIIVQATLRVASAIISASSLSFLGLGVPAPSPEWGALLSGGRKYIRDYSYMTLFPGLAIMITVLALNLMGDGLRDALDPKLKK